MRIGFVLFEKWHNRKDIASSRYRGHWIIKYWPEAEVFKQGQKYDAVIYQKVYWLEHAQQFEGIKILDICDPDWLEGHMVKEMVDLVDAVTCSTEVLARFMRQLTDKPVIVIPDRQDLEYCKEKKIHRGKAKSCVWFGYSHNSHVLRQTIPYLMELGLKLTMIAEKPIVLSGYGDEGFKQYESWKLWKLDTVGREIIKHDIALLPYSIRLKDQYKSNNKMTYAWSLGMPVATNYDELRRFIDEKERKKEAEKRLREVREKYDVRQSVVQFKELVGRLKK
uniref:Glycosyltransferase family 1 protein n=1 Tax=Caldisericum exile TaxID=693075 RepID=A0A7C4U4C6_9BACT